MMACNIAPDDLKLVMGIEYCHIFIILGPIWPIIDSIASQLNKTTS
jgi:hypothetical protein